MYIAAIEFIDGEERVRHRQGRLDIRNVSALPKKLKFIGKTGRPVLRQIIEIEGGGSVFEAPLRIDQSTGEVFTQPGVGEVPLEEVISPLSELQHAHEQLLERMAKYEEVLFVLTEDKALNELGLVSPPMSLRKALYLNKFIKNENYKIKVNGRIPAEDDLVGANIADG
jgi:hypothetical protein